MFLKADFHLAENIARSTFSAHFLLNCSNQIQISEHISKESEREKSIARHFPLNGNPPLLGITVHDIRVQHEKSRRYKKGQGYTCTKQPRYITKFEIIILNPAILTPLTQNGK